MDNSSSKAESLLTSMNRVSQIRNPQSPQLGRCLTFSEIEKGLRELNPDVSVDAPVKRPSEYSFAFKPGEAYKKAQSRQGGVYYLGRYVAAVDHGMVPEVKVWQQVDGFEEVPMADAEKYDDGKVVYIEILPSDPFYNEALTKAQKGDDNYQIENGKVFRYEAFRWTKVRGPVQFVGWRHTFEKLIAAKIPGITREAIASKFNVNMNKIPIGERADVIGALREE